MLEARTAAGSVVSLWRYPIKSMLGEELNAADLTSRGVLGDRAWALLDTMTGKVASAKNPRVWPRMFEFRARYAHPPQAGVPLTPIEITFPDGTVGRSDERGINKRLSSALGRDVVLTGSAPEGTVLEEFRLADDVVSDEKVATGAPQGTWFDFAPLHIITTATLSRLQELHPQGRIDPRRFRPNVIVRPADGQAGFVENEWVSRALEMGEAVVSVQTPCPRCVMTTLAQSDLPADPGILRMTANHNTVEVPPLGRALASVGVYASVVRQGRIVRNDSVMLHALAVA